MKKIFTLILFVAAFGIIANAANEKTTTVKYAGAEAAPVADGYIDDFDDPWDADTWVEQAEWIATTEDATSQFNLMHNDAALLLAVMVSDATPFNDATAIGNSYERDCIEIFISMDTVTNEDGSYKDGCWQIRFQREAEEGAYIDGNSGANTWSVASLVDGEGFSWGVETGSSEWVLETVLPKEILAMGAETTDGFIRFDIATADNTTGESGGRTQQLFWNVNSDQQWHQTRDFGFAELADGVNVNEVKAVEGTALIQNGVLKVNNVNGAIRVFDMRGALVQTADVDGSASIDVSGLNSGMYIVKGENLSAKVVK